MSPLRKNAKIIQQHSLLTHYREMKKDEKRRDRRGEKKRKRDENSRRVRKRREEEEERERRNEGRREKERIGEGKREEKHHTAPRHHIVIATVSPKLRMLVLMLTVTLID